MRTGTDPREVAMSTMNTTVRDAAPSSLADGPWIRSRKFDLFFLTASGALVFLPYLSYGLLQRLGASTATASLIVGLAVTLVVIGSFYAFLLLLTAFFFWASVHVTHQAQFISETYRRKVGSRITTLDRLLDGAVILGALYTVAMYKFVTGRFTMGSSTLLFPEFLKHIWVAQAFTAGFALLFLYYVIRTMGEIRRGETSWPRLLFMAATVGLAFIIPLFDNLDVAFQGFNTWHSLQYLALTWFILTRQADRGEIGNGFVRGLSGISRTRAFYAAMVGATVISGGVYLLLWRGLGMPQDRAYYVVVLSFLLVHYFYDHFLFRDFAPLNPSQFSAVSYQSGAPSPHLQTEN